LTFCIIFNATENQKLRHSEFFNDVNQTQNVGAPRHLELSQHVQDIDDNLEKELNNIENERIRIEIEIEECARSMEMEGNVNLLQEKRRKDAENALDKVILELENMKRQVREDKEILYAEKELREIDDVEQRYQTVEFIPGNLNFPVKSLANISSFLDLGDISRIQRTCKTFEHAFRKSRSWKIQLENMEKSKAFEVVETGDDNKESESKKEKKPRKKSKKAPKPEGENKAQEEMKEGNNAINQ
jgi:hypothetical protein